ncbi:aldehyde dehydrogenase family protein [Marinobacterium sp. YM272]|uniref:aldehyde dehydrogenase family protein n=1 Tax=Marinobacterium sp. YM272 TaxID=3421654 RepID=UPI003D7F3F1F
MTTQSEIDKYRNQVIPAQSLLIDGQWREAAEGQRREVISPIDGKAFTSISSATAVDVDAAVQSARHAFEDGRWRKMAPAARKKIMHRFADLVEQHAVELAVLGVRENGTEICMAINAEPGSAAATLRYYAEAIDKVCGEIVPSDEDTLALVRKEPIGVVGAIVPWNFPLMIGTWKLAPAIAAGNSVVLKPAETASLSLLRLAELALEAGLPDGVLNVVTGTGLNVGEPMGLSQDIDVLAFTGSGATGSRLLEYASRSNLKRCYLELGGKSANIVFADMPDFEQAAQVSARMFFRNSGQVCVAPSRLLVQDEVYDAFVNRVVEITQTIKAGDPLSLGTDMGTVHSEVQLNSNLKFVQDAREQGGVVRCGGQRRFTESGGFYMEPTVIDQVLPEHRLAQEEVFGPVLGVTRFKDVDDALRIANGTRYGLSGAVWTSNLSTAHRVSNGVRSGLVHVNTYGGADCSVPLGGMKQSGNGVDKSLHAFDKYMDLKTVWMKL